MEDSDAYIPKQGDDENKPPKGLKPFVDGKPCREFEWDRHGDLTIVTEMKAVRIELR